MLRDKTPFKITNPAAKWLSKPGSWKANPLEAFHRPATEKGAAFDALPGTLGAFAVLGIVFAVATQIRKGQGLAFAKGFPGVFLLAIVAYVLAGQSAIKAYNLEYALLWALLVGLIVCNTIRTTPAFMKSAAASTEFYIKTGLVLLGAEVLLNRLLALGAPGIIVSWIVTPVVLITTFIFGQKVLKMEVLRSQYGYLGGYVGVRRVGRDRHGCGVQSQKGRALAGDRPVAGVYRHHDGRDARLHQSGRHGRNAGWRVAGGHDRLDRRRRRGGGRRRPTRLRLKSQRPSR